MRTVKRKWKHVAKLAAPAPWAVFLERRPKSGGPPYFGVWDANEREICRMPDASHESEQTAELIVELSKQRDQLIARVEGRA
jgi:hypothetical protein